MARPRREWVISPGSPTPDFQPHLPNLLRQVLWARRERLGPDFSGFLTPGEVTSRPETMGGMNHAVELVLQAIRSGERVAIFGDYDADGVTATAILNLGLLALGADVITYIPHRVNDGYGLNPDGLMDLHAQGARLVITCDCGTNSVDVVAGRPPGQRLIVTDHHLPAAQTAQPDALLNPHQAGDGYRFKELSGAGVAFRLVQAVAAASGRDGVDFDGLLQLVAIGAVADVVPLLDENRALVGAGLRALEHAPLPGLKALMEVGQIRRPLRASSIAFQLAPRINAAGRMDDARLALDLLLADDPEQARPMAEHLERHNLARREATEQAMDEAQEILQGEPDLSSAIVLADPRWSLGLVGLIAGRLVDGYSVPAFVMSWEESECRGSARSVDGLNVVDALASCAQHLTRYGGHAAAAGFACDTASLPALADGLRAYAAGLRPEGGWSLAMGVDGEVSITDLTPQSVSSLDALEPCGSANPRPRFCARGVQVRWAQPFGTDGEHMKLWLAHPGQDAASPPLESVAWRKGAFIEHYRRAMQKGDLLDVLFSPAVSNWDGSEVVQLELEDVRRAEAAAAVG